MISALRAAWRALVKRMSAPRALEQRRFVADFLCPLWVIHFWGSASTLIAAAVTRNEEFARGVWAMYNLVWTTTALRLAGALFWCIYLWFCVWMALDAYARRFGDSDGLSVGRLLWLAGIICMWPLVPVLYWFAVKRKAVVAELRRLTHSLPPAAA